MSMRIICYESRIISDIVSDGFLRCWGLMKNKVETGLFRNKDFFYVFIKKRTIDVRFFYSSKNFKKYKNSTLL